MEEQSEDTKEILRELIVKFRNQTKFVSFQMFLEDYYERKGTS